MSSKTPEGAEALHVRPADPGRAVRAVRGGGGRAGQGDVRGRAGAVDDAVGLKGGADGQEPAWGSR